MRELVLLSMKSVSVFISLLVLFLIVFKYFENAKSIYNAVNPDQVKVPARMDYGTIKSCRYKKILTPSSDGQATKNSFRVLIVLKENQYGYPIGLRHERVFEVLKKVCDEQSVVSIEYTSINKKLERLAYRHVNQVVVQETGLVIDSALRINSR